MTGLRTSLWWATRSEAIRRTVIAAAVLTAAAVGYAALATGAAGLNSDNGARSVPVERVYTSNDLDVYLTGRASLVAPGRKSGTSDDSGGSTSGGSKSDESHPTDSTDSASGDSGSGHSDSSSDDSASKNKTKGKNSEGSSAAKGEPGGDDSTAAPGDGSTGAGAASDSPGQGDIGPLTTPGVVAGGSSGSSSSQDGTNPGGPAPHGYSAAGDGTSYNGDPPRRLGGSSGGGAPPEGGSTGGGDPPPAQQNYSPTAHSTPPIARGSSQDGQGTAMFACSKVVADLAGLEQALATATPNEVICYQRASSTNTAPDYSDRQAAPRGGAASYDRGTGGNNVAPTTGSIPDYSAGDSGQRSDSADDQTNSGQSASGASDGGSGAATGTSSSAAFRPTGDQKQLTIWLTGYSWQDNNPPGSSTVSHPVLHKDAGGTGTYADPITVAVPGQGAGIWKAGAGFYLPTVQRYVIVEDTGASAPPAGQDGHLDMWIGGQGGSKSATDACMDRITGTGKAAILNPPPGLKVMAGPIFANGTCNVPGGSSTGSDRS